MNRRTGICMVVMLLVGGAWAEPAKGTAKMPVEEVTVFKDGHAFVLHGAEMPVNEDGNVVMDYLPSPVIGTFWPYSADKKAKLSCVTASQHKVIVDRTALNLKELIEANVGAKVIVTELSGAGNPTDNPTIVYEAAILDLPAQSGDEQEALDPSYSGEKLPVKGNVALLKTDAGVKVVNLDRIQSVSFMGEYNKVLPREEFRNRLTLKLDWAGKKPAEKADVGLLYLQKGIRWIPSYKVTIDGKGQAVVKLQATLVNELADLDDVVAHLVIGVPTFAFKDTIDPISLTQVTAQLSPHFQEQARTAYAFSNAIMTQAPGVYTESADQGYASGGRADLGPEVGESGKNEDLFVFTVEHVSLKKGDRMVLSVGEFPMEYKDVYTLDVPFSPPAEVWSNSNNGGRDSEMAQLFAAPKVMHKIRLQNKSEYPLTTAPAMILKDEQVLAQGMMTYAASGADSDLNVTTTVDIRVKKNDNETDRTPNAVNWQGDQYGRVNLAGKITLTGFREDSVEVEVVRHVLGNVDSADNDGKIEMVNVLEDPSYGEGNGPYPYWWGRFSWPWWWHHFNQIGRIKWTVDLEPNKPMELNYTWNYYWR